MASHQHSSLPRFLQGRSWVLPVQAESGVAGATDSKLQPRYAMCLSDLGRRDRSQRQQWESAFLAELNARAPTHDWTWSVLPADRFPCACSRLRVLNTSTDEMGPIMTGAYCVSNSNSGAAMDDPALHTQSPVPASSFWLLVNFPTSGSSHGSVHAAPALAPL